MGELRRLDRIFVWSLYVLIAVPFAMIALGGGVGPVMGSIFGVGVVGSWFFARRDTGRIPSRWWNVVAIGAVLLTAADLLFFDTSILSGGIRFVLILTLIKLFSRHAERDELQLFALSFLMLAAATTVNEEITFGILFGVYVLVGTFTMAVFHLRSELDQRPRLALYGGIPLNARYVAVLGSISGLILAASLSIFFLFPRIGLGFFAQQSRDGVSVSGFNDRVQLGDHGTIRDNPQVVMRVEFPEGRWPELGSIHWRTMTFDYYDGRSWSQTLPRGTRFLPSDQDDGWDLTDVHPSTGEGSRLQIYLEPLGTNVLPVVWPARSLRLGTTKFVMPWGPRAGEVKVDAYGDLRHTIEADLGVAYLLSVGKRAEIVTSPGEPNDAFLQMPPTSERLETLAREVTRAEDTAEQKAIALERHLESNYQYTTDLPAVGEDPIDSFLFETRVGHCEYFATSMVLLLRANGIHARLVNGFLGGRWNETGGYLAVRQGDAHSWVEYWSPGIGWVPIDPTPPSQQPATNEAVEKMREIWDSMRLTWTKWVIEYDLNAQIEFFRRAAQILEPEGLMGGAAEESAQDDSNDRESDWRTALLVGGLATLLFFAYLRVRRRLRRHDSTFRTGSTALFWMSAGALWMAWFRGFEFTEYLSGAAIVSVGIVAALFDPRGRSHGSPLTRSFAIVERAATQAGGPQRSPDEGPAHYLERVATHYPALSDDLERFSTWYLRARFAGRKPTLEEVERLREIARRIADAIQRH
jgi:uncharacterized membrane protein (DUF485 family)